MTGSALLLVLGAAVLHAAWNALAKRARAQLAFLWSANSLASLLLLPFALWILRAEGLPARTWPFVLATIVLHALYFWVLGRAYRTGELSLVYPIARGLGVALVPVLAFFAFDERLSPVGAAGIGLVVLGILGLHLPRSGERAVPVRAAWLDSATGWAVLTGLTIALYSLVDKAGVGHLHPVPYVVLLGLGSSLLLLPAVLASPEALRREWTANWRVVLAASTMILTAYLLVLFAFRLSKVGYVVAARELSIVLSALIGSRWLGEGSLAPRLAGAGVVLAGVVCVAVAR